VIANRGRGRMVGSSHFGDAVAYIVREGPEHARRHEPPLAVWSENVASIATAPFEMQAAASQSRAQEPLYHLIISWDDAEKPSYEQARAALDSQLRHLGFVGLQYVAALQNDGKSGHYHVHAVVNRVDPVTHVAREVWQDRDRMRAACREAELLGGWRRLDDRSHGNLSHGARDVEYHTKCRSFERYVREVVGPQVRAAVGVSGASWGEVHRVLAKFGVRYEAVSLPGREGVIQGGRIVGSEPGEYARARDLGPDLTHRKLEERLGGYERDPRARKVIAPFSERCAMAAREVSKLPGGSRADWGAVHAIFERRGLEYQQYRMGARIVDLDSPEAVKASEVDRKLSLGAMSERFGEFASSAAMLERKSAREAVQRAEQLVLGAQLIADPSPLLERLTANHATFTLHTAEKLVCERLRDPKQRQELLEKIVASSIELEDVNGKSRLTTAAVLDAERRLSEATKGLATSRPEVAVTRSASSRLDDQQQRAYAYAVSDESRLKVITGVPGAGKTTLINEIAAGYREAGYTLRAVSIANSAVDVLRRETDVPACSVAKELYEWGQGRGELGKRDVLIIDEVSTLGTAQGAELLSVAFERGAVVIALGDDKQFQAVAHGNALEFMQRAVGDAGIDLAQTRRQREEWQREATHAVRRGDIGEALDAYRERGLVHERGTQDGARAAFVARWAEIERSGVECGLETFTNAERQAVNMLAREEWRVMGRLSGAEKQLETVDGLTSYAVGDRVVIRETIREAGLFNGSVGTVRGIEGEVLRIERRDGQIVPVDTRVYPGIQHGYCSTEYREQGSTRYAELQLVTKHVSQRSLTVGMTRHTDAYGMYYSREEVGSYQRLVDLGYRTSSKELASDFARVERGEERAAMREVGVSVFKRELEQIGVGKVRGFSREEREVAFWFRNHLDQVSPRSKIEVHSDWHRELREAKLMEKQIEKQIASEREQSAKQELSQERELSQAKERGRGRGLGR
jgi:ATP-dependent exoDNAse (exonuclease V) alpha subunit